MERDKEYIVALGDAHFVGVEVPASLGVWPSIARQSAHHKASAGVLCIAAIVFAVRGSLKLTLPRVNLPAAK